MINATKQANEFGSSRAGQTVVSPLAFITGLHSVGLKATQGPCLRRRVLPGSRRAGQGRAWSKRAPQTDEAPAITTNPGDDPRQSGLSPLERRWLPVGQAAISHVMT
jgi:hypothetical protein